MKLMIVSILFSLHLFAQENCRVIKAGENSDLDCRAKYLENSKLDKKISNLQYDTTISVLECLRELNPVSLGSNLVFDSAPIKILNFGDNKGKRGAYYNISDENYFLSLEDLYNGEEKNIKVFNIKNKSGKTEKVYAFILSGNLQVMYEDSFNKFTKTKPEILKLSKKDFLTEPIDAKSPDYINSLNEVAKERISTVKNYFDLRNEKLKSLTEQDQTGQDELTALLLCKKFYESKNLSELVSLTEKELMKIPLYMKTSRPIKKTTKVSKSSDDANKN